jgi:hypothetical protein
MSASSDGSGGYYLTGVAPVTAYPFSLSFWVKYNNLTINAVYVDLEDDTDSSSLFAQFRQSNDTVRAYAEESGGTSDFAASEVLPDTTNWHLFTAIYASSTSRIILMDGDWANRGTDTAANAISALDDLILMADDLFQNRFNGFLAEVCFWDAALSQAEAESLYTSSETGVAADTVKSGNVISYYPLLTTDSLLDAVGANDLTNNGSNITFVSDHPTISGGAAPTAQPAAMLLGL